MNIVFDSMPYRRVIRVSPEEKKPWSWSMGLEGFGAGVVGGVREAGCVNSQ